MDEREIFIESLRQPDPAGRLAYVDQVCGVDADLRRRVLVLLAAFDQAGSFLQEPAVGPFDTAAFTPTPADPSGAPAPAPPEEAGTVIGPYKLLQAIGEGGMGTVFLAEQEHPVRRRVALKVIKAGMDTAQVIARFEAERQALALMDHPHIARVLDAGATETGRPYFVMELVQGLPITRYCDEARLTLRERLELMIPVCQAVQHAHQKGIIHRDLKPSNVLVTEVDGKPVPKVIDFGIAKATARGLAERTLFTQFGALVGTPEYMSPEQAGLGSMDVDTRSDVYALGVLLYELLTGTTPLERSRLRAAGFAEILRQVREEEPPTPSSRLSASREALAALAATRHTEPARLARLVRGELDWIVMRALEKDRTRRYETASGLARDLQRYLDGDPVEAGPPSRAYRLRKFARKHRAAFATAGAFAAMLLLAATVSTILAIRATRAEVRADGERLLARKAEAAARRERDAARAARDAQAVARRRAESAESDAKRELAKFELVNRFLTEDLLTQAEPEKNAFEDHVTLLEVLDRAAETVGKRFADQPELESELRQVIARTYHGLASWEKAERQWRAVRESATRRLGPESAEALQATSELGLILDLRGQTAEALPLLESATWGLARVLGPEHPGTLASRSYFAHAYRAAGRTAEAIPLYEAVVRLQEVKLGPDHPSTLNSLDELAHAYRAAGRTAEALALLETVVRLKEAKLGPDHPDTLNSRNNLALTYHAAGRTAEALALLEAVVRLKEAKLGPDHLATLASRHNLAGASRAAGRTAEAIPLYEEVVRVRAAKLGPDHPDTLTSVHFLAHALETSRPAEAEPLFRRALEGYRRHQGPDGPLTADLTRDLANLLEGMGRSAEAEPLLRDALDRARSRFGPDHPQTVSVVALLGLNLLRQEKWAGAEPLLRACLAIRAAKEPGDWSTFNTRSMLGDSLRGQDRHAEAEPLILAGYEGQKGRERTIPPPGRIRLSEAAARVVRLYEDWGKPEEAARWRSKLAADLPDPDAGFPADPFAAP